MAHCSGTLQIALGCKSVWYISVGYICGEEKHLNVCYELSINEVATPCIPFGHFQLYGYLCHGFYPLYSKVNLLGYEEGEKAAFVNTDYKIFRYLMSKVEGGCYKYTEELGCRSLYPECVQDHIVPPCRKMCFDFLDGCKDLLFQEGFSYSISCTPFPNSLNPDMCVYKDVTCQHPGEITNGMVDIITNDSVKAHSVYAVGSTAHYKC